MKKNVPPAHFGYMATGADDEMTLRANRDGFRKFELRPRRLVDVSKIDMSAEILGVKYDSPRICGQSPTPPGIKKVYRSSTQFSVAEYRTQQTARSIWSCGSTGRRPKHLRSCPRAKGHGSRPA
jgi:isopentenyl diphosphate isomerase/L-lactate dehydrogenase-like FMN-dependent dehydrogenase